MDVDDTTITQRSDVFVVRPTISKSKLAATTVAIFTLQNVCCSHKKMRRRHWNKKWDKKEEKDEGKNRISLPLPISKRDRKLNAHVDVHHSLVSFNYKCAKLRFVVVSNYFFYNFL